MIRLKNRKRVALVLSIGAFVGLTSALSAKETATPSSWIAPVPLADVAVVNPPVNPATLPDTKVTAVAVQKTNSAPAKTKLRALQSGVASYYGPGFHGRRTANGETFNQNAMTAAHRTLPFGTKLKVTNLNNGQSAVVRINDRGPYVGGRVIDLSVAAAKQIGSTHSGTAKVKIEVVEQ